MIIQAFAVAEHAKVLTPVMVNLDGFVLTHTYELVDIPAQEAVDRFLPPFQTTNKLSFESPTNMGFTATPAHYAEFKFQQHQAILDAAGVIADVDRIFGEQFGRHYGGLLEAYRVEDAEQILITLGSVTGTARVVVDQLRETGQKVGLIKLRYLRPFPAEALRTLTRNARALGVLEKNISLGYEGTVFTNVRSVLSEAPPPRPILDFVAGLGGRDISKHDIAAMFAQLATAVTQPPANPVIFVNLSVETE